MKLCLEKRKTVPVLTYLNVDSCVTVHPNREHSILEHNSNLIKQLCFQGRTVEVLYLKKKMVMSDDI